MLSRLMNYYCSLPGWSRRPLWKVLHRYLDSRDGDGQVVFMNYGYADGNGTALDLRPEDEQNRYCMQLYNRIVSAVDIGGRDHREATLSVIFTLLDRYELGMYVTRRQAG